MSRANKVNLLNTVPVCSPIIQTEWGADGCAVLISPRFRKAWMQRWLVPRGVKSFARIPLEEHGSAVWALINGQRTVNDIIALLADHFPEGEDYAPRVTAYLVQLHRDHFIKLACRQ